MDMLTGKGATGKKQKQQHSQCDKEKVYNETK